MDYSCFEHAVLCFAACVCLIVSLPNSIPFPRFGGFCLQSRTSFDRVDNALCSLARPKA